MADQEVEEIAVRVGGQDCTWVLEVARCGREWLLALQGGERAWSAKGADVFEALRALRAELDNDEILLGCNGARANAWASGMQRDMGEGKTVYLCALDRSGRPPVARPVGRKRLSPRSGQRGGDAAAPVVRRYLPRDDLLRERNGVHRDRALYAHGGEVGEPASRRGPGDARRACPAAIGGDPAASNAGSTGSRRAQSHGDSPQDVRLDPRSQMLKLSLSCTSPQVGDQRTAGRDPSARKCGLESSGPMLAHRDDRFAAPAARTVGGRFCADVGGSGHVAKCPPERQTSCLV